MAGNRTFYGIQVLRGLAALAVVCFHLASTLAGAGGYQSLPIFYAGNGGVDLFFLISGFVIVWTTQDQWWRDGAWSTFLKKRLLRVVPLYWVLTTGKLVLVLSLPFLFRAPPPTAQDVVLSYLLLPAWDATGRNTLIITAGWTLCYEMAFYYVAAICLAFRRRPATSAAPVLVALGLLGIVRTPEWGALASLIDPLLLEFVAGMWIAELTRQGKVRGSPPALLALLLLGLGAWLASGLLPASTATAWRVIVWGLPAAFVLYAVIGLEARFSFRSLRLPLLIGDASYSIYLTHVLILQPLVGAARKLVLPPAGEWAVFTILLALSLSFGVLAWWGIERKLIHTLVGAVSDRWKRA